MGSCFRKATAGLRASKLRSKIRDGSLDDVKAILQQGAPVNYKYKVGDTVIHVDVGSQGRGQPCAVAGQVTFWPAKFFHFEH